MAEKRSVTFLNGSIEVAGSLFLPEGFDHNGKYAAMPVVHPGGGVKVNADFTDHRVKAVGTVSAVNIGASWRRGWYGTGPHSDAVPTLQAAAQQRTAEAAGAETAHAP